MKNLILRSLGALPLMFVMTFVFANEPEDQILITNVHVFDGVNEDRIMNANVLVEGALIKKVSQKDLNIKNARRIDGGGRTLMPGLIDMHWHSAYAGIPMQTGFNTDHAYHLLLGAKVNEKVLMNGFTTVRDVGGNVFSLAKQTDAGIYIGPRIFPSGPAISQTSGHTDFRPATAVPAEVDAPHIYMERIGHVMVADGVPEVLKRSREALRMGATQIKINSGGGVSFSLTATLWKNLTWSLIQTRILT